MAGFTRVADVAEIRDGRGRAVFIDGVKVALFRRGDRYYAVGDRCPHMGASLSEGFFSRGVIQCHWHGWRFDAATGRCQQKSWAHVPTYEVRVEGRDILLRAAPPTEPETGEATDDEPWMTWQPPED